MTAATWPVQPLLDQPGVTPRSIRRVLGLSGATWKRAVAHGLTDRQADRAAIRHGHMPHGIWPDWIDAGLTAIDRQYLAGGWRQVWLHNEENAA